MTLNRFYDELAEWWPLFSPASDYAAEADDLLARLGPLPADRRPTLLELGAGGGSLAFHLKQRLDLTLTDRAPGMLAVSRSVNPESDHRLGDMRSLRLGRQFDVVLIHDAIMYATTEADVEATLATAAVHCRPGGRVAVLPDCTREPFTPATTTGGHDAPDGRGLRYLAWSHDPDPADDTFLVDYAFQLRATDGRVTVTHDRHLEGLFDRARWLRWLATAGFAPRSGPDPWDREVFIGIRGDA